MSTDSRRSFLAHLAAATAFAALPGCGLILHPERQGSRGQKLDAMIVVLDGLLCLLFVVPGIIAFAVDVGTGCIYWPDEAGNLRRHRVKGRRRRDYERALREQLAIDVSLDSPDLLILDEPMPLDAHALRELRHRSEGLSPASDWAFEYDERREFGRFRRV